MGAKQSKEMKDAMRKYDAQTIKNVTEAAKGLVLRTSLQEALRKRKETK